MLFCTFAEYVMGTAAVYIFLKNIFTVSRSALFFTLSATVFLATLVPAFFVYDAAYCGVAAAVHCAALTLLPLCLKGPKKAVSVAVSLFFSAVTFFASTIVPLIISAANPDGASETDGIIGFASNVFALLVFLLFSVVFKVKTTSVAKAISKTTAIFAIAFIFIGGLLNLFGTYYVTDAKDYRTFVMKFLIFAVSALISISVPLLSYNQIKKNEYMYENELYERQLQTQINYYKSITSSGYELRKFRHDYGDLSNGIKAMVSAKSYEDIPDLVKKYDNEIIGSFHILYNTGNDLADAIFTDKQTGEGKGIPIKFNGSLANVSSDRLDLCVLLNNTLDIAIDSVKNFGGDDSLIIIGADARAGFLFYNALFRLGDNAKKAQNKILHHSFAYKTLSDISAENGGIIETNLGGSELEIKVSWSL